MAHSDDRWRRAKLFARDVGAGTAAGISVTLIGHPFDTLKVRLQTQPQTNPLYNGLVDCFQKTLKWEGVGGLYKGVMSPIMGQIVFRADMFVSFAEAKRYLSKSSILNRYVRDEFDAGESPTIGAAFLTKTLIRDGNSIKFEIWDTAGQERYHSLAPMYYRGSLAVLIVYDITSPVSFDKAKGWVDEIRRSCPSVLVMHLVGCKTDLRHIQKVSTEDASRYASNNDCAFVEVSAKTGENVNELFDNVAKLLCARKEEAE